ncbi:hypothetical protein FKG94_19415 [Exilibacterium tricleocarpae]|uniref:OmpR/PhoB-type domain-containing protein n=1 Tax=Exilibacterium tricleocarpae TaxID=2591008 RepID=A0A545T3M0_9GAMM|nr:winged helix-turn-helix domain-containing protein [Exilibacterium tricleocarpae]TQV71814.1 hypothetical protein FKG94_19415 [Exilibacterium tricleocarpae]
MTTVLHMPDARDDEVSIGPCRLLLRESALIYADRRVRLEPKVARVLRLLGQRCGEVVSRQELIDQVWAGRPVTDDAVTRCISLLRKALDRQLEAPVAIETLAKNGYRLNILTGADSTAGASAANWHQHRYWLVAALGLAAVLVLALLRWPASQTAMPSAAAYERRTLVVSELLERYPSFSPDGALLTYASGRRGAMAIYVRELHGRGLQRLTAGDSHDHQPVFAPDQTRIAFARVSDGRGCELWLVPVIGGRETLVGDCGGRVLHDLVWSGDGTQLLMVTGAGALEPARLRRISLENGAVENLSLPVGQGVDDLAIAPDGGRIAVSVQFELGVEDIFIGPSAGRGPWQRVTRDLTKVHGLAWAPDGGSIVFTSNRLGPFQLWRAGVNKSTAGVSPVLIPEGLVAGDAVDVSADGNIVLERWRERSAVVELRLPAPAPATGIVRDKSVNWDARPSAPGGSRVFVSDRSGSAELWLQQAGELFQLTRSNGPWVMRPRWSPNRDLIAYTVPVNGAFGVRVYDVDRQRQVPEYGIDSGFAPFWSAAGESLYFGSQRGGQWQIWRKNFSTGELLQITRGGAKVGQLSADGQTLYFTKAGVPGIWKTDLGDAAKETLVVDALALVDWNNWQVDEQAIYYVQRRAGAVPVLKQYRLATAAVSELAELPDLLHFSGIWVAAGAARVWYAKITEEDADIEILFGGDRPAPDSAG